MTTEDRVGMNLLEEVQRLDDLGLQLLPAKARGKRPVIEWRQFQSRRTTQQLRSWFRNGDYNVWMMCGSMSGVVVLDIDSDAAETYWRGRLGEEMLDATTLVRTGSGKHHYWFRILEGDSCPSWGGHDLDDTEGVHFDVRSDGTGVIIPPSIHESGDAYEWVRDLDCLKPLPNALRSRDAEPANGGDGPTISLPQTTHSMLAQILSKPPVKGSRNDWLTRVAGHIAKHIPYEDAYRSIVGLANQALQAPLDDEEFEKTVASIWRTEQTRDRSVEPHEDNGWLASDGRRLLTPAKVGDNTVLAPWSDFDIRVLGVIEDDRERSYSVELVRGDDRRRDLLEPQTLGRPAELTVWLTKHGATVLPPGGDLHKGSINARLQRYLESQEAPHSTAVKALGWNAAVNGFVTHEGIITQAGMEPHGGVMPHPVLANWAPYRYGFVDPDTARKVLGEVLSFHDPDVCAVFGAWWAACFLKAQIMEETALFPFMALEAPSESGKTTGFFALMMQLNGNLEGHGEYTLPVLRDRASAHRSGIVWVDDMSDASAVLDLVRQVTGEGSRAKKGQDRQKQESVRLVAPVAVSGEGLGALELEKALLDRAVKLEVGSPKARVSSKDATRPQWDDVKDLMREWDDDLTQVAGTLVQMALAHVEDVRDLRALRKGTGRHADKIAILRLGARVLADLSGQDWVIARVDKWCDGAPDIGNENVLTTQILPQLLRNYDIPSGATGYIPVFYDPMEEQVWFSEEGVADAWRKLAATPREKQLGGLTSIRMQRRAMGAETKKRVSIRPERKRGEQDVLRTYYALDLETSAAVMGRTGLERNTGKRGKKPSKPEDLGL